MAFPEHAPPAWKAHHFIRSREAEGRIAAPAQCPGDHGCLGEGRPRACPCRHGLVAQVLFNVGTTDLTGQVNGIDVMKEVRYYKFTDYLVQGDPYDLATGNNTIVSGQGPGGPDGGQDRRYGAGDHRHRRPLHAARGGLLPNRHRGLRQGAVLCQHQDRAEAACTSGQLLHGHQREAARPAWRRPWRRR